MTPHNYQDADGLLQGRNRNRRKLENNTYLERHTSGSTDREGRETTESIAVRLHGTDVVVFMPNGDTVLNTGGWRTLTTRARINTYLPAGFYVYQERGQWYVSKGGRGLGNPLCLFQDNMVVKADGSIEGGEPIADVKGKLKVRKQAQQYARKYIKAFRAGNVPAPGAGDCFFCSMRDVKTRQTLGELSHDRGEDNHILMHIKEDYFVPSLLARSLEVMPASIAMKDTVARVWTGDLAGAQMWGEYVWQSIQKNLSRYVVRQLGQAS